MFAGCRFCANTISRRPGGEPGTPAGPCAWCGHVMFWISDAEAHRLIVESAAKARGLRLRREAVRRAVDARRVGSPVGTRPAA
jgi:hypothetical protein